jgi:hypothetical protein
MSFEVVGEIVKTGTIAASGAIRELNRLRTYYGKRRWAKRKGFAKVGLADGSTHSAELHWYEAHGVGRVELKIKRLLSNGSCTSKAPGR